VAIFDAFVPRHRGGSGSGSGSGSKLRTVSELSIAELAAICEAVDEVRAQLPPLLREAGEGEEGESESEGKATGKHTREDYVAAVCRGLAMVLAARCVPERELVAWLGKYAGSTFEAELQGNPGGAYEAMAKALGLGY
jgi:hypothetical protein